MLLATGAQADTATAIQGWGSNGPQFVFPSDVSQFTRIAFGGATGYALKSDGTVAAWGDNYHGQCDFAVGLNDVVDIAAGYTFAVALKADGTAVAWGSNDYGETSTATLTDIKAISAKAFGWMALKNDGTVAVFGYPYGGRLDIPAGLSNVKAISCGYFHCLALQEDGTVVAWGDNSYGGCDVPAGLTDVKALSGGEYFSVALKNDGTVVAWGLNYDGECNVPAGLSGVVSISAAESHVMALKSNGTVVTWGSNYYGETTPKPDLNGVVYIATEVGYSVALINKPLAITTTLSHFYSGSTSLVKGAATFLSDSTYARTITLTSSDPAIVVPASVVVPRGAKSVTFKVTHNLVADAKTVTITGVSAEGSFTTEVSLLPIAVKAVTFDLNKAEGGGSFNGILTLNAPPRETLSVALSGDAPGTLFLNSSVDVAPSNKTAYFPVTTQVVPVTTIVHVTAQVGSLPKTVPLTILAGPKVKSFRLSKTVVYGNQKLIGTVTLSTPAHAGGTTVYLACEPGCTMPATVNVPEGSSTASFEITSQDIETITDSHLTASTYYSSVGASLKVRPNTVASVALSPSSLEGGQSSTATVTLIAPVDVDTDVDISIPSGYASAPATLTIRAGASVGTVTLYTQPTTRAKAGRVVAGRHGVAKYKTLTINP